LVITKFSETLLFHLGYLINEFGSTHIMCLTAITNRQLAVVVHTQTIKLCPARCHPSVWGMWTCRHSICCVASRYLSHRERQVKIIQAISGSNVQVESCQNQGC